MNKFFLDTLCCPFCSGKLSAAHGEAESDRWEYAVLSCYCDRYPVVAGIPIIRKGALGAKGQTTGAVSQLIESGKNAEALLSVAMPPEPASAELAPSWLQQLPQVKGIGRIKSLFGRFAVPQWTTRTEDFLTSGPQGKTAKDYFNVFLGMRDQKKDLNYFMNRFGQPRQLVALSLMTVIESPQKPVLDFGCGFGHLTSHLTRRVRHQSVIGADRDFIRLYVAKNFLAPDAFYVCCDGDTSWPFMDGFFSAAYTSDVLYMVRNKVMCSRELQRVVDADGLIVAAGIRNGLVDPQMYPSSMTMPYHAYGKLFDPSPHRIIANTEVLDRYLNKRGPDLSRSSERQILEAEPWFSIVATKRQERLVEQGSFADWPHAEGLLELNPLYKPVEDHRDGTAKRLYRHTFPSSWYEEEDGDCRKYEPDSVGISSHILTALSSRKRTDDMEALIAQCVIVGVPERFH